MSDRVPHRPSRRAMLLGSVAAAATGAAAIAPGQAQRATGPGRPSSDRPNILLIIIDDMGFSDLSPYGGEIYTLNIARLADQGCLFSNFHVAPTCSPTRSMLLTGADNHLVGLGNMKELLADNQRGKPGYEGGLNGRAPTVAALLRDAGYHTYIAGKWHLGQDRDQLPAAQGFEESVILAEGGADNYEKKPYTPKYKSVHFYEGFNEIDLPSDFYSTKYYTDRLIGYIDKHAGDAEPFFGVLAFQAVHQPQQVPAEYTERYVATYQAGWDQIQQIRYQRQVENGLMPAGLDPDLPGTPDWTSLTPDQQRLNAKRMAVYAGMLEYVDMSVGRLVEHLKQKQMLDRTAILLMSDNGGEGTELLEYFPQYYRQHFTLSYEHLGEKGSYSEYGPGWAAVSGTPLSGLKISTGEGGTRSPLIVRYPPKVPAGRRTSAFAYVTDIVPTLLELAGVAPQVSEKLAGRSLVPLVSGAAAVVRGPNDAVVTELAGNIAVYRGEYKLMKNLPPTGDGQWHLYNLVHDPREGNDLAKTEPGLVRSLQADYADYAKRYSLVEVPEGYNLVEQSTKNAKQGK